MAVVVLLELEIVVGLVEGVVTGAEGSRTGTVGSGGVGANGIISSIHCKSSWTMDKGDGDDLGKVTSSITLPGP